MPGYPLIVPDFGDTSKSPVGVGSGENLACETTDVAAPATSGYSGPRKLVLICSKGNLDMAYPGLILANAALGEGIETHIFFTFWGLDIITKGQMENLEFTMVGNTAMRMTQVPKMPMPQILGIVPGMTTLATKMMRKQIADLDVPTVPEMLDIISASGGHMWACKMSFDMMKLRESQLHEGVEAVISATDFMELSEGAQTIFI